MELKDIHTERFIFNPKSPDFEDKLVSVNPIFNLSRNRKKWLTYLAICYDVNSEIRRNHPEYMQRKFLSAQIAGFKLDEQSGKFTKYVEARLLKQDEEFNKVVSEFCRKVINKDYELYELLIDKFNLELEKRNASGDTLDETGRKNLQAMKKDIEDLEKIIFGGEESVELKNQLYNNLLDFLLKKYSQGIQLHKNSDKSLSGKDRQLLQKIKADIEVLEKNMLGEEVDLKKLLYEGVESLKDPLPRKEKEMELWEKDGLKDWNPYGNYIPEKLKFVGDEIPSTR